MQLLSSLPLAWVLKANTAVGIEDLGGFLDPLKISVGWMLS